MSALVASTKTNAEILRIDDEVGTVAEGKLADLVLWSRNPLDDPSVFDDPDQVVTVIQRGKTVKDRRH